MIDVERVKKVLENIIAPQALLFEQPQTKRNAVGRKECLRSSIKQVLRRIGGSDQGPPFELFRDYTDVFE